MKLKLRFVNFLCVCMIASLSFTGVIRADSLFEGRQINLSNSDNRVFSVGVTGTTAGHNYLALIENARQESIPLGDLGYWELVPDPPASLRNYDLQLIVRNNYTGIFQIEFEYINEIHDIIYRIKEGSIQVRLDHSEYYPTFIIDGVAPGKKGRHKAEFETGSRLMYLFDFNSFDVDIRKYYGAVKRLLKNKDSSHYFYYYESGNYNSYYFRTYRNVARLDTDKMGLSLENGTLGYYQKILDNLNSRFGAEFAGQVVIVSRFGSRFSNELNEYAHDIGMNREMEVTFLSYEDIE